MITYPNEETSYKRDRMCNLAKEGLHNKKKDAIHVEETRHLVGILYKAYGWCRRGRVEYCRQVTGNVLFVNVRETL